MIPKSKSTIKKVIAELVKIIDQYNWDLDNDKFAMVLSMIMYPADNVRFTPIEGEYPIEMYVNGIIQSYMDSSILDKKDQILSNLFDEEKNPLYVELGKILDTAFEWRRFLEKIIEQRPLMFSNDHTIQFQLDMDMEDYIEIAVNDMLIDQYTNVYDIYHTFIPEMEKVIRSEVSNVLEDGNFEESPEVEKSKDEKPEFEHYDYLLFKKEHKKRMEQEKNLKVSDELNPDDDDVPENPKQDSETETPPNKNKLRKLKRRKKNKS